MKKQTIFGGIFLLIAAFWIVGLGGWPFLQWSPLNRSIEEVDINSGRIRKRWELVGIYVKDSVEETAISRMIASETPENKADWRSVNTFSPLVRYSPHHAYHGAIFQISSLNDFWKTIPFSEEAKKQTARDLLMLWQLDKGYFSADKYVVQLELLVSNHSNITPIKVKELPDINAIISQKDKL